MADVFLSYASENAEFAGWIVNAIQDEGISVFWDREIPVGKPWDTYLDSNLGSSRCVVVVWSMASVESEWVKEEAHEGRQRRILVPVRAESVEPPFGYRRLHTANLTGWDGSRDDPALRKLLRDITEMLSNADAEAQPVLDLSGIWQGDWCSVKSDRRHDAALWIPSGHGDQFEAVLTVTYIRQDERTVIQEIMSGSLEKEHLLLNGDRYAYLWRGKSAKYSLDAFDLGYDSEGDELVGVFRKLDRERELTFRRAQQMSVTPSVSP